MADDRRWRLVARPLVLNNLCIYDGLNSSNPDTGGDLAPSATDIPAFTRQVDVWARGHSMQSFSSIRREKPEYERGNPPDTSRSPGTSRKIPSFPGRRKPEPFPAAGFGHQRDGEHPPKGRPAVSPGTARGFSLVEVVIAVGILAFALLTVVALLPMGFRATGFHRGDEGGGYPHHA